MATEQKGEEEKGERRRRDAGGRRDKQQNGGKQGKKKDRPGQRSKGTPWAATDITGVQAIKKGRKVRWIKGKKKKKKKKKQMVAQE